MKSTGEIQQDHSQHLAQKPSETVEMTQEHREALLKEYELAHYHTGKWDNAAWQTAAIFLSASLAGFIVAAQISDFSRFKFLLVSAIGLSAIIVLLGWLALLQYLEKVKRVMFFRMREIEQDLGLWKNRYYEHLHIIKVFKGPGLSVTNEDDKARLQRLEQAFPTHPSYTINFIMKMTAIGLTVVWVALIILEFIFTFVR